MTRAVEDVLEEIGAGDSARAARAQQGRRARRRAPARARVPPPRRPARVRAAPARASTRSASASPPSSSARCATSSCSCPSREGGTLSELHEVAGDLERDDTPRACASSVRLPAVVAARYDRYAVNGAGDD